MYGGYVQRTCANLWPTKRFSDRHTTRHWRGCRVLENSWCNGVARFRIVRCQFKSNRPVHGWYTIWRRRLCLRSTRTAVGRNVPDRSRADSSSRSNRLRVRTALLPVLRSRKAIAFAAPNYSGRNLRLPSLTRKWDPLETRDRTRALPDGTAIHCRKLFFVPSCMRNLAVIPRGLRESFFHENYSLENCCGGRKL